MSNKNLSKELAGIMIIHPSFDNCEIEGCSWCKRIKEIGKLITLSSKEFLTLEEFEMDFTVADYLQLKVNGMLDKHICESHDISSKVLGDFKKKHNLSAEIVKVYCANHKEV